ncbi:pepsin A1 [Apiospora rasikravindrae]|uniref:Pepsin A1 n=1 Tax=Apiospora rasikravindrae TaxID=990691 RepID=A0ABR1SPP9_9PEZI
MRNTGLAVAASILAMLHLAVAAPLGVPVANSSYDTLLTDFFNRTDNQASAVSDDSTQRQLLTRYVNSGTPIFSQNELTRHSTVLVDTGSPYLMLPASNCTSCGAHTLFDAALSDTFSASAGTAINPQFATGADAIPLNQSQGATCYLNADTVEFAGLRVQNQPLLLCDSYAPALNDMPIDGILGMGLPNETSAKAWYWNVYDSGVLQVPEFGLYLIQGTSGLSEMNLGGLDADVYKGNLQYTRLSDDVSGKPSGWVIDQQSVSVGSGGKSVPLLQPRKRDSDRGPPAWAVLDTGTAFIQAPDKDTAAHFYAQISSDIRMIDPAGAWGADCGTLDKVATAITFTLGPQSVAITRTVPKEEFNLGEYPGQKGICQAVVNSPGVPSASDSGTPVWVLGSPLLKQYYTSWDGINRVVGWAERY